MPITQNSRRCFARISSNLSSKILSRYHENSVCSLSPSVIERSLSNDFNLSTPRPRVQAVRRALRPVRGGSERPSAPRPARAPCPLGSPLRRRPLPPSGSAPTRRSGAFVALRERACRDCVVSSARGRASLHTYPLQRAAAPPLATPSFTPCPVHPAGPPCRDPRQQIGAARRPPGRQWQAPCFASYASRSASRRGLKAF